jgi:hypothetical protein
MMKLTAKISCSVSTFVSLRSRAKEPSAMTHEKVRSSISNNDTYESAGATACAPQIESLMRRAKMMPLSSRGTDRDFS